jgi:hypothetical protein
VSNQDLNHQAEENLQNQKLIRVSEIRVLELLARCLEICDANDTKTESFARISSLFSNLLTGRKEKLKPDEKGGIL